MIRDLMLDPAQAEGLAELLAAKAAADTALGVGFTMVVRGFGVRTASDPRLSGNRLTITVPDEPESPEDGS